MSAVSANAASAPEITFVLFRHAETGRNVNGTIQGWDETPDTQLTEKGIKDADELGKQLAEQFPEMEVIYSSSSKRCVATAEKVVKHLTSSKVIVEAPLAGINHGDSDGLNYKVRNEFSKVFFDNLAKRKPAAFSDPLVKWKYNLFPGADNVNRVCERIHIVLSTIATKILSDATAANATAAASSSKKITIGVSITTVPAVSLRTMAQHTFSPGSVPTPLPLYYELNEKMPNCGVYVFRFHPNGKHLENRFEFIKALDLVQSAAQANTKEAAK